MDFCNNYFKILIIILLISVVFYLLKQIKENFDVTNQIYKINYKNLLEKISKNNKSGPSAIKLMISKSNSKNRINLTWFNNTNYDTNVYYLILMYKNNKGPYIIDPELKNDVTSCTTSVDSKQSVTEKIEYNHEISNLEKNIRYKFAVVGIYCDETISNIDEFIEVVFNIDNIELKKKYTTDKSKVICNSDGSYKISEKCNNTKTDINAEIYDNNNIGSNFNNYLHKELMDNLNSKNILELNF